MACVPDTNILSDADPILPLSYCRVCIRFKDIDAVMDASEEEIEIKHETLELDVEDEVGILFIIMDAREEEIEIKYELLELDVGDEVGNLFIIIDASEE